MQELGSFKFGGAAEMIAGKSRWHLFLSISRPLLHLHFHSSHSARSTMTPSARVLFLEYQKG